MCAEIVLPLRTNRNAHSSAVANMFEKSQWQKPIFRGDISVTNVYKSKGSSVLDSLWASDHLYTLRNSRVTAYILVDRVKF